MRTQPFSTVAMAALLALMALQGCASSSHPSNSATTTDSIIEDLEAAERAMDRGDLNEAERLYRALADESPDLISPHFQLGVIAYQQQRLEDARRAFKAVRERDVGHVLATHNLAIVHLETARQLLREHQRLAPVSARRPALVEVRRAIRKLGEANSPSP